jgi:hypothetical protein
MHLPTLSPWRRLSEAIELRRLKRRLPNAHRAWSQASGKLRPETDVEYLARLRVLACERQQLREKAPAAPAVPPRVTAAEFLRRVGPIGRIADDLRDALKAAERLTPDTAAPALIEAAIDQTQLLLASLARSQRLSKDHQRNTVVVNLRLAGSEAPILAESPEGRGRVPTRAADEKKSTPQLMVER